ncbi:MAG: hypothetical protein J07AB43_14490 [Candidatus Nanosalina sp. J07AB43]|nr:MAG: hypothetical protein J07AB43_14490 [Candidatus Nanosalina sp. J07AB43]
MSWIWENDFGYIISDDFSRLLTARAKKVDFYILSHVLTGIPISLIEYMAIYLLKLAAPGQKCVPERLDSKRGLREHSGSLSREISKISAPKQYNNEAIDIADAVSAIFDRLLILKSVRYRNMII